MKRRFGLDETGQMSIFVALIFQVLFVFFAMVVNIGLIVHDKINLQNAVDLGAYYAAERQAEILNEIAHLNYQIRQDYKLLTWRYRVLGTLGRQASPDGTETDANSPPARTSQSYTLDDTPFALTNNELPAVCIANIAWGDVTIQGASRENYCFRPYNTPTTLVRVTPPIAFFVPGVLAATASELLTRNQQLTDCTATGPRNWRFTMQMIYAYKLAIAARKELIFKLRRNLIDPNFRDSNGETVREGVLKTIKKNLTSTNKADFDEQYFEVYNGLSHPDCVGPNQNGDRVLAEVAISPLLLFTNVSRDASCSAYQQIHTDLSGIDSTSQEFWDPNGAMRSFLHEPNVQGEQFPEQSSLGFEKNPWCMAYVGVHVRSTPRKPFAPFGQKVLLEARAFAQPFGGRIGPWYRSSWNKTSPFSDGPNRVDPLTTPRLGDGGDLDRIPNFSRYPGDQFGLKSKVALGAQRHILKPFYNSAPGTPKLRTAYYAHIDGLGQSGDPLAFNPSDPPTQSNSEVLAIRAAELGAIAPDLFDATYYSIDPNFFQNYFQKGNATGRYANLPPVRGRETRAPSDIGSRIASPQFEAITVESQIDRAYGGSPPGLDPSLVNGDLRYHLKSWMHLLTGWTLPKVQVFTFPDEQFGKCAKAAPPSVMIPGKCAQNGGRVGYSVRLLSRDYLFSDKFAVGGDGVAPNSILNPPSPSF